MLMNNVIINYSQEFALEYQILTALDSLSGDIRFYAIPPKFSVLQTKKQNLIQKLFYGSIYDTCTNLGGLC